MQTPSCKADVKRAMGLIDYVGRVIPNLATNMQHLCTLLRDKAEWEWSTQHEAEWQQIKMSFARKPVLAHG